MEQRMVRVWALGIPGHPWALGPWASQGVSDLSQRMLEAQATSTPDGSAAENVEFLAESPHQADICTEAIPRRAPVTSQRALPRPGGHRRATDKQRFRVCLLRRAGALQRNAGGHLGVSLSRLT